MILKKCGTYYLATVEGDRLSQAVWHGGDFEGVLYSDRQGKGCIQAAAGKPKSGDLCFCRRTVPDWPESSSEMMNRGETAYADIIRSKPCILLRTTIRRSSTLKMHSYLLFICRRTEGNNS